MKSRVEEIARKLAADNGQDPDQLCKIAHVSTHISYTPVGNVEMFNDLYWQPLWTRYAEHVEALFRLGVIKE